MATHREDERDLESSIALRVVRRIVPVTSGYHGQRFFKGADWNGATAVYLVFML
jgi:hypothetical protein